MTQKYPEGEKKFLQNPRFKITYPSSRIIALSTQKLQEEEMEGTTKPCDEKEEMDKSVNLIKKQIQYFQKMKANYKSISLSIHATVTRIDGWVRR